MISIGTYCVVDIIKTKEEYTNVSVYSVEERNMGKAIGKIYEETNYLRFKTLTGNRHINERHVRALMKSFTTHGWVGNPITVDAKMYVTSGQHRYEAAKRLGIPVKYIIEDKEITVDDIRSIDTTNLRWNDVDQLQSLADGGNVNYINYMSLYKEFVKSCKPALPASSILAVITHSYEDTPQRMILKGDLQFPLERYDEFHSTLQFLYECLAALKTGGHKIGRANFAVSAILFLIDHGAERTRLLSQFKKHYLNFNGANTIRITIEEMCHIYNKGLSSARKVYCISAYDSYVATRQAQGRKRA